MINFTDGVINLGVHNISIASDYRYLESLAIKGLMAKRDVNRAKPDYYFEEFMLFAISTMPRLLYK